MREKDREILGGNTGRHTQKEGELGRKRVEDRMRLAYE